MYSCFFFIWQPSCIIMLLIFICVFFRSVIQMHKQQAKYILWLRYWLTELAMWLEITRPSNEIETQEQEMAMEGECGRQRATGNHNESGNGNEGKENAAWTWSWHWNRGRDWLCGFRLACDCDCSWRSWRWRWSWSRGRDLLVGSCFANCIRTCNQHVPCMSWNVLSSWRILFSMQAVGL